MASQTIALAAAALLATAPAHALVANSSGPRPILRRRAAPVSSTVLRYLDVDEPPRASADEGSAEAPALIPPVWENSRTVKRLDRQAYFDFVAKGASAPVESDATLPSVPGPLDHLGLDASSGTIDEVRRQAPGSRLLSLPSSVASLLLQAQTVAEEDRRAYFEFVKDQKP